MGELKRTALRSIMAIGVMAFSLNAFGQAAMAEVVETFNAGVTMMKMNPDAAIASFEKTVSLADQVGEEAAEIKDQALKQIPKMYWESAKNLASKKDYEGALEKLEACITTAKVVDDASLAGRANTTALSILNVMGSNALSAGDYPAALDYFDQVIARESRYAKAYLGKVLVYSEMKDYDKMEEIALLGIETAKSTRDNKTAGDIQTKLRSTFLNNAQVDMQSEDYASAVENLKRAIEYGGASSAVWYQLGQAQQGVSKWADAVNSFTSALELELGGDEDKAKIYFEMARSYQELSDVQNACANYRKAMFGDFAEAAKYQIETVLKCGN
jgi:tetratricopeptide (TPR) repeat protein